MKNTEFLFLKLLYCTKIMDFSKFQVTKLILLVFPLFTANFHGDTNHGNFFCFETFFPWIEFQQKLAVFGGKTQKAYLNAKN